MTTNTRRGFVVISACVAVVAVPALSLACGGGGGSAARPFVAQADPLQQGIAHYNAGRYAEAEGVLRGAAGPEADAYRGASLAKLKRYAEAEGPSSAALAAVPIHPVATAGLGESLVGQKKYDDAVARMSAVIDAYAEREDKGNAAYAFYWRGQAHYAKGSTARAIEDFQVFLQLAPEAPEAQTIRQLLGGLR
jgi:tetratricopeptide (TPR) repeat protein